MAISPSNTARALRAPGYLILGIVFVQSILDLLSAASPFLPHLVAWRVRAAGMAAGSIAMPLMALLLMLALAISAGQRRIAVFLAIVSVVGALLLTAVSGMFVLDATEMSRAVPAEGKMQYAISALYALAKLSFGIAALLTLAWTVRKTGRAARTSAATAEGASGILVRKRGGRRDDARNSSQPVPVAE